MISNAYAVLDTKVGTYSAPFFAHHHQMALRSCINVCRDSSSAIAQYMEDYVLFWIGQYDDNLGLLTSGRPENLGNLAAIYTASLRSINTQEAAQ